MFIKTLLIMGGKTGKRVGVHCMDTVEGSSKGIMNRSQVEKIHLPKAMWSYFIVSNICVGHFIFYFISSF